MKNTIKIGKKSIGDKYPCFVVAEIAQAHDGSLGQAHSFIDAAAESGADAIKFQTHIARAESTKNEKFRVNFSFEDKTRYEYWQRTEFTLEQWQGLANHAADKGLTFLSSPFSVEAVELLEKIGVPAYKIGSGEVNNIHLFESICSTGKPILLSSGMSSYDELDSTIRYIKSKKTPFALFQCTSKYPTTYKDVGLNVMTDLMNHYRVPVGLSDHSGKVFPSLAAMAQGAHMIEFHVIYDRRMFGPDSKVSLTFDELRFVTEARDAFHIMRSNPVNKDTMAKEMASMRILFNKSVSLKADLPKGTKLSKNMLTTKKPGSGIPAKDLKACIGKSLLRDVKADELLDWKDLA